MSDVKICTFYGMRDIVDVDFIGKAREAIRTVVEENDSVEFWFHITGDSYNAFLAQVLALRTCYPEKHISLVYVSEIDPKTGSKENPLGIYYSKRYQKTLPLSLFDKVIFTPPYIGKSKNPDEDSMRRFHHTQSWVIDECDVLISYVYHELFESESTFLKRYSKKVEKVVSLTCEDTTGRILSYIANLEEKDRMILEDLLGGLKVSEIARNRNVSNSAIDTKINRAGRNLKERIKRDYRKALQNEDRNPLTKCAVCGLNSGSAKYLHDITVLINFLKIELGVREYYIPHELCFDELVGPMISMSRDFYSPITLIAVVPEDCDTDAQYYCPPYGRMLSISNLDEQDYYKNLISECSYLICDLTAVETKDELIAFCATAGISVIDVSVLSTQLQKGEN